MTRTSDSALREAPADAAEDAELPPQLHDPRRYQVLGEHGRGGLGRVSRAHDRELGRDIAIKELISRGNVREVRFLREALITARLEHPGIVPVYEAGRWPDGTPFYAMKLVAGRSLRELIAERTTLDERIGLLDNVIAVADAIAYAHGRNIIHRDLKPANIIVGDFGETIVIDWGLAKDLSAAEDSDLSGAPSRRSSDDDLTSAGTVLGTPAYMAPEQERGDRVDQRIDVFAIGVMLWELCTLQRLPAGGAGSRARVLRRSGVDGDLAAIITKAVELDPDRRYRDAGALAADLKAFKLGARIAARRYSLWAMLAHWTRRHRPLALSLAGAIALATAGAILYVHEVTAERDRADASEQGARRDRAVAVTTLDELTLQHAELLLASDPSAAIDALASYHGDDVDRSGQIRAEAIGRGVAALRATPHSDAIRWVQGTSDGAIISMSNDGTIARTTPDGRSRTIANDVQKNAPHSYAASRHLLAYLCEPDNVCLLDIATGRRGQALSGYAPSVLSFAPDGSRLALLSRSGDLWILDVDGVNPPTAHAPIHAGRAGGVLFVARDAIALGTRDGVMVVRPGGEVRNLREPENALWERGLDDHHMVLATAGGEIYLVGTDDLKISHRTRLCRDPIVSLRTIRAADAIAYACMEGTVGMWTPATGAITLKAHLDGHARALIATGSGDYLFAAGAKGVVTRIDVARGNIALLRGHTADLTTIDAPTAEYPMAISGDSHGGLRAWPPPTPFATTLGDMQSRVLSALYDAQRRTLVAVGTRAVLLTYSAAEGLRTAGPHTRFTQFVAVAADGHSFVTYGSSSIVERWSLSPLERAATLDSGQGSVSHAEFVAATSDLVTSGRDGRLIRWSGSSPRELHRFEQTVDTFAIAGDGAIIAATGDGALWRVEADHATALHPDGPRVTEMRAMPDGDAVIVGRANGALEVLEPRSGRRTTVASTSRAIGDIAVARDGEMIAVAAGDGTVRLGRRRGNWLAAAWTSLPVPARHVAFTRDGLLMSIGSDGAVWLYAPALRRWGFVQASVAELTALAFDERDATAFVFDVDGRLVSIDLEALRKQITSNGTRERLP